MRILCVGAGAIGICIGGSLAAQGADVSFLVKERYKKELNGHRLMVQNGERTTYADTFTLITSSKEPGIDNDYDCLLVAVKAFDTDELIKQLQRSDFNFHSIVSLQNGVDNEMKFHRAFPDKEIIGASIVSAVSRIDLTSVKVEKNRGIGLAGSGKVVEMLYDLLNGAGLKPQIINNMSAMKWSKMISNLFANATSAILDMTPYEIYRNKDLFKIERRQILETLAVMKKLEIQVVDLPGLPVKLLVWAIEKLPNFLLQPLLTQFIAKGRGDKMPSFYIEKMKGSGKSEVNDLNGAVARYGEEAAVPVPINQGLTRILSQITKDRKMCDTYSRMPGILIRNLGI